MVESAFRRIRRIEDWFTAAQFALEDVQGRSVDRPDLLPAALRPRTLRDALGDLERTYVVRLFAEFERLLRDLGRRANLQLRGRSTATRVIDRFGARSRVAAGDLSEVHDVRRWRNDLVHDAPPRRTLTLAQCRSRLCRLLGYVQPREWLDV